MRVVVVVDSDWTRAVAWKDHSFEAFIRIMRGVLFVVFEFALVRVGRANRYAASACPHPVLLVEKVWPDTPCFPTV
jgi:hypothetical protein